MEFLELAGEITPSVLSILACIIAFMKGRKVKTKTAEEIEELAEAKKQKIITKLNKKNKITPLQNDNENTETSNEVINENYQNYIQYKGDINNA